MPKRKYEQLQNENPDQKVIKKSENILTFFQNSQINGKINTVKMLWKKIDQLVEEGKIVEAIRLCEEGNKLTKPQIKSSEDIEGLYKEVMDSYKHDQPVDHIEFLRKEKELIEIIFEKKLFEELMILLSYEDVENAIAILDANLLRKMRIENNLDFIHNLENFCKEQYKDLATISFEASENIDFKDKKILNFNLLYLYMSLYIRNYYDNESNAHNYGIAYEIVKCSFTSKFHLLKEYNKFFKFTFLEIFEKDFVVIKQNLELLSNQGLLLASNLLSKLNDDKYQLLKNYRTLTKEEEIHNFKKTVVEGGILLDEDLVCEWINDDKASERGLCDENFSNSFEKVYFGLSCTECTRKILGLFHDYRLHWDYWYADYIISDLCDLVENFSSLSVVRELIKIIQQKNWNINSYYQFYIYFFEQKDIETIRLLIEAGVDINESHEWNYYTPAQCIFRSLTEDDDPETDADDSNFPTLDLFKLLLEHNADFNISMDISMAKKSSIREILELSIENNKIEALELMAFWYANSENKEPFNQCIEKLAAKGLKEIFDLYVEGFEAQRAETKVEEAQVTLHM